MYMQKSNSSGTCNKHYFLERGDKKLYNLICVGVRIARFKCVWFFANVTDPFNITIHNTEQSLLRMLERYLWWNWYLNGFLSSTRKWYEIRMSSKTNDGTIPYSSMSSYMKDYINRNRSYCSRNIHRWIFFIIIRSMERRNIDHP